RQKLIAAIAELEKRAKDKGYASRLERYPLPRLLDMHAAKTRASKRAEAAAAKQPAKAAPTKTAAKTAQKAPAKKSAELRLRSQTFFGDERVREARALGVALLEIADHALFDHAADAEDLGADVDVDDALALLFAGGFGEHLEPHRDFVGQLVRL